jgi:hypothetical protein
MGQFEGIEGGYQAGECIGIIRGGRRRVENRLPVWDCQVRRRNNREEQDQGGGCFSASYSSATL